MPSAEVAKRLNEYETRNNINADLLEALEKIADTSPNWMQKDAVADSERRMRQIAQEAIRKAKEKP